MAKKTKKKASPWKFEIPKKVIDKFKSKKIPKPLLDFDIDHVLSDYHVKRCFKNLKESFSSIKKGAVDWIPEFYRNLSLLNGHMGWYSKMRINSKFSKEFKWLNKAMKEVLDYESKKKKPNSKR